LDRRAPSASFVNGRHHRFECFSAGGPETDILDAETPRIDQKQAKHEVVACKSPCKDHRSDASVKQRLRHEAVLNRRARRTNHPFGQRVIAEFQFAFFGQHSFPAIGLSGAFQCHIRCHDALPESVVAFDKLSSRRGEIATGV